MKLKITQFALLLFLIIASSGIVCAAHSHGHSGVGQSVTHGTMSGNFGVGVDASGQQTITTNPWQVGSVMSSSNVGCHILPYIEPDIGSNPGLSIPSLITPLPGLPNGGTGGPGGFPGFGNGGAGGNGGNGGAAGFFDSLPPSVGGGNGGVPGFLGSPDHLVLESEKDGVLYYFLHHIKSIASDLETPEDVLALDLGAIMDSTFENVPDWEK